MRGGLGGLLVQNEGSSSFYVLSATRRGHWVRGRGRKGRWQFREMEDSCLRV